MGLYLPGNGLLHRWHPLTKLALAFAAILLAFAHLLPWKGVPLFPWLGVFLLSIAALLDGTATFRVLMRRFLLLWLPILILLLLVQGFFFPPAEDLLLQMGPFGLKSEGLFFGANTISCLALILQAMLLATLTTHPADLTHALTEMGVPREIAYVILAAIQLIPRMKAKAHHITSAQQARGLQTEGNLLVRIRGLIPLVGPLINSTLYQTQERALALEARAFRFPGPKTSWRQLHDTLGQRLARWLIVFGAIALFVWGRLM
ncbi:MAG: energy-coupling factor transporter transmembrane component T family protein [Ardenticatenaceae bacterium]